MTRSSSCVQQASVSSVLREHRLASGSCRPCCLSTLFVDRTVMGPGLFSPLSNPSRPPVNTSVGSRPYKARHWLPSGTCFRPTSAIVCRTDIPGQTRPAIVQDKPDIHLLAERILELSAGTSGINCRACGASLSSSEDLAKHGSQHMKTSQLRQMASTPYWRCGHRKVQREVKGRRIIYRCLRCFQIAPGYNSGFCIIP